MPRPRPLLYTIPNFQTAGSGRALFHVATRLDRERYRPAVAVLKRGGGLEAEFEAAGIPVFELPFTAPIRPYRRLLPAALRAAREFRPHGFEIWHSYHYSDDYSEPLIARLAGARAWVFTKKNMGWGSRAWRMRTRLATRIAVQNTDMMARFFTTPAWRRKARPLPRGVDTVKFQPGGQRPLQLRESLGIGPADVVLGVVAHLVPVKGHPTLIDAVARVPGVRLIVAGKPTDAGYAAGLQQQCQALGVADRVHFVGGLDDVPAVLAELDIFVLPTWAKWRMEGCPVALLEAMSCGAACIATDIPGSRDLVEDGRSGRIVPPEDAGALAGAIRELAGSAAQRQAFGRAARQRVLQHFSIEREVAAHAALYAEILGLD